MSCDRNGKLAAAGGMSTGLTALNSKISHSTGVMLQKLQQAGDAGRSLTDKVDQVADRADQVTDRADQVTDRADQITDRADQITDRLGRLTTPLTTVLTRPGTAPALKKTAVSANTAAGQLAGRKQSGGNRRILNTAMSGGVKAAAALLPPVRTGLKVARIADGVTAAVGTAAAATTMTAEAGEVSREKRSLIFFKTTQQVSLWKSGLTSMINKRDVIGTLNKDNVLASDGVMFETGGKAWHRGTSVVKMPSGKRTITHLQSLNAMAGHYYFERSLSDEQAVGVACGQIEPETIPGYVGRISPAESLCPALANSKRLLLLTRLHWPPPQERKL